VTFYRAKDRAWSYGASAAACVYWGEQFLNGTSAQKGYLVPYVYNGLVSRHAVMGKHNSLRHTWLAKA